MHNKKPFTRTALARAISLLLTGTAALPLYAQQAPATDKKAETSDIEVIQVRGMRGSLQQATAIKRESMGVVDAISAEDIGKFPDTNLAESLQRITGVSISRTNGEGAEVTVRGFGGDNNMVTLNGRTMPSATTYGAGSGADGTTRGGSARAFDFSNLASESISGVEVYKTSKANIATGGIGGVHRGAELSFDISADLPELAQTPVTVVAAGAKAILDLPKTLEYLETSGVPVIAYGQDEFPAFWSRNSGLKAPLRMDSALEIANAHKMRGDLGLPGGQLVANPIPEAHEIPREEIMPHVEAALAEAASGRINAKEVTPFLLQRIFELTAGRSLEANIELVLNNARLAAAIARAMGEPA